MFTTTMLRIYRKIGDKDLLASISTAVKNLCDNQIADNVPIEESFLLVLQAPQQQLLWNGLSRVRTAGLSCSCIHHGCVSNDDMRQMGKSGIGALIYISYPVMAGNVIISARVHIITLLPSVLLGGFLSFWTFQGCMALCSTSIADMSEHTVLLPSYTVFFVKVDPAASSYS